MAKDKKVEQITDMEVDFAQWFTDVCTKAPLIDYSSEKGVFIYRAYEPVSDYSAPLNFSLSVLRPLVTGIASTFSQKSA